MAFGWVVAIIVINSGIIFMGTLGAIYGYAALDRAPGNVFISKDMGVMIGMGVIPVLMIASLIVFIILYNKGFGPKAYLLGFVPIILLFLNYFLMTSLIGGRGDKGKNQHTETVSTSTHSKQLYNTITKYEATLQLNFDDFSITPSVVRRETKPPGSSKTFVITDFIVKRSFQTVKVTSIGGQLPPRPVDFVIGDKKYTLYTFKTPEGERMGEGNFFIESLE